MDTEALIIDDEALQHENNQVRQIRNLGAILRNNPEIPDAMRDMAPYFSRDMRIRLIKMAAVGDFLIKMTSSAEVEAFSGNERLPINGMYSTMKKYIPMNKRQSIDGIMGLVDNVKTKMQVKPASNGIENVINTLSRINEINKFRTSAGAVKQIADTLSESRNGKAPTLDSMLDMIGGIVGEEKMSNLLGKINLMKNA